jgi:cell division GTPase FtsZ
MDITFKNLIEDYKDTSIGIVNTKESKFIMSMLAPFNLTNIQILNENNIKAVTHFIIPCFELSKELSRKDSKNVCFFNIKNIPYNILNVKGDETLVDEKNILQESNDVEESFETKITTPKLERFANQEPSQAMNCVFIGTGQAGINITDRFMSIKQFATADEVIQAYKGVMITSFAGDVQETESYKSGNKDDIIFLKGLEKGSGRDRELAKTALPTLKTLIQARKDGENSILTAAQQANTTELYKMLEGKVDLEKTDVIIVEAGLSGGTGAGTVTNTISTVRNWLDIKSSKIKDALGNQRRIVLGCLGVLPLTDVKELRNTRDCIGELAQLANDKILDFFLPVDNLHMSKRYKKLVDSEIVNSNAYTFKKFINEVVVNWFHEINVIATKSSIAAFDMKDLLTIFQPSRIDGGAKEHIFGNISINKHVLSAGEVKRKGSVSNLYSILNQVIDNPTMTDAFDKDTLYQLGVIIVKHPGNMKVTEDILLDSTSQLKKEYQNLDTLSGVKIGIIENDRYVNEDEVLIYTVSKFIGYPKRINELKRELQENISSVNPPQNIKLDLGNDEDFALKREEQKNNNDNKSTLTELGFGIDDEDELKALLDL